MFERFRADWTPDLTYRWQQNRAVVGHNLKIAWNLTRCAYYFQTRAKRLRDEGKAQEADGYVKRSDRCLEVAQRLADRMGEVGLDKIRGGIFDCVERNPSGGMPTQFAWGATKDFWQQEQGILAYLILYGATGNPHYLRLARECRAFWNLFFLDRERQGYFFRTTENGLPILEGQYGMKSSHAIGYHAFELAYLAHLYTRAYVAAGSGCDNSFCLYFKICSIKQQTSINVLPDFMPPGRVRIYVRSRQRGGHDGGPGSGQSRRLPDPDGRNGARPDERNGRTRRRVSSQPGASKDAQAINCYARFRETVMADRSLAGKKIAVLVESQYVSAEIRCYQERFAGYGAEVHLMSRLWGQPKQTFVSEVEEAGKTPETLDVGIDFTQVKLDDYAAVIMAANYTSVRLRWNEAAATSPNAAEMARCAPAVVLLPPGDAESADHQGRAVPRVVAADALAGLSRRATGHLQSGGAGRRDQRRRLLRPRSGRHATGTSTSWWMAIWSPTCRRSAASLAPPAPTGLSTPSARRS